MIIFINGNMNSGKSTVAKLLAERFGNCAVVEIDALRAMIEWMPIDQAVPLNWKNAVAVTRNFYEKGLNVVVPYPLSRPSYDYVCRELVEIQASKHFVTLDPPLEMLMQNRGDRELDQSEAERIKFLYERGIQKADFGIIIDNSTLTPMQTVDEIVKRLGIL